MHKYQRKAQNKAPLLCLAYKNPDENPQNYIQLAARRRTIWIQNDK